jgi:nucleotide-binding universal stress UspA family protein
MSVSTIMVAYDGSATARRALAHAADIVGRDGTVVVVNVVPVHAVGSRLQTISPIQRTNQEALLGEAYAILRSHGVHAELVRAVGDPGTEILSTAQQRRVPIVAVGRGRRWRRLTGRSLALRLAARAETDVLVVG